MKMHRIGALVTAAVISASAEGAVLVSNLAEPTRATTTIDVGLWALQSFVTDANTYNLVSIQTVIGDLIGEPVLTAELRDYLSGSLLTTFTIPDLAGPLSVKTLTPAGPVTLQPDTLYALVLGVTGEGSFGWSYAEGENSTGPGSLFNYAYSSDQGLTFADANSENPYKIQVNVEQGSGPSDVPEPSTLALSASALIAASILRWLQRPPR